MNANSDTPIDTVEALIDALGGPAAAAAVLDVQEVGTLRQWKARGKMPSKRFVEHTAILAARQITASPRIWGQAA